MVDITFDQLPVLDTLEPTASIPVDQNGNTYQMQPATMIPLIGGVQELVQGSNITIDATDPQRPIINATGGGGGSSNNVVLQRLAPTELTTEAALSNQLSIYVLNNDMEIPAPSTPVSVLIYVINVEEGTTPSIISDNIITSSGIVSSLTVAYRKCYTLLIVPGGVFVMGEN